MNSELAVLGAVILAAVVAVAAMVRAACGWIGGERAPWSRSLLAGVLIVGAPLACALTLGLEASIAAALLAVLVTGPVTGSPLLTGAGLGLLGLLTAAVVGVIAVVGLTLAGFTLNIPLPGFMGAATKTRLGAPLEERVAAFAAATERLCGCAAAHTGNLTDLRDCAGTATGQVGALQAELTGSALQADAMGTFLRASARAQACSGQVDVAIAALETGGTLASSDPAGTPRAVGSGATQGPVTGPATRPANALSGAAGTGARPLVAGPVSRDLSIPYSYRQVAAGGLADHIGKLVRVTNLAGQRRTDQLVAVAAGSLSLRTSRAAGNRIETLPLDDIAQVEVLDRWPS